MKPCFILVRPQIAENIGATSRAMMNCGLSELRLVSPRESPLSDQAMAMASGSDEILKNAKVFETLSDAVADLNYVYATTSRRRGMTKTILRADQFSDHIEKNIGNGLKCGVLFGKERTGLENEELAWTDAIVEIPLNPEYRSLNLAQAVLLMGYEYFKSSKDFTVLKNDATIETGTKAELDYLFHHIEQQLDLKGYFKVPEKKARQIRNIRNIFLRAGLTGQEIRTMHGIITELAKPQAE